MLATVELSGALAVARLIAWDDRTVAHSVGHQDHGLPGMPGMSGSADTYSAGWGWPEYTAIGVAAAALVWLLLRRHAIAAVLAAAAVAALVTSPPVRLLATRSHLVAMVALELLLVVIPLLLLAALRGQPVDPSTEPRGFRRVWAGCAVAAALLYAGLLIVIHLPAVHHRSMELGAVPLWVAAVALAIGVGYWFGVLRTAGRVATKMRRAVLLGAQEVAAFVGLLSLFGDWGAMDRGSPLGIPAHWDQRLGGAFMMATCAAVAIPIYRRLGEE